MAKVRAASNQSVEALCSGWELCELEPKAAPATPEELEALSPRFLPAAVPGTVAGALSGAGLWDFERLRDLDEPEFWFRTRFASTPATAGESLWLCLDGLATLAEVFLNGTKILSSDNMFHSHELDVTALVAEENRLCLRFSSLKASLAKRRPRPRYRTRLVEQTQLRWFRTSLLGRIPAFTPRVVAVGPYRGIRLERRRGAFLERASLRAGLEQGKPIVRAGFDVSGNVRSARLVVGDASTPLMRSAEGRFHGVLSVPRAEPWWPHTHGASPLYRARVLLEDEQGTIDVDFGALGFRSIEALDDDQRFALKVNGVELFCRGACWTNDDIVTLGGDNAPARALELARRAGMNALRVGGTMCYESSAFYDACDAAGILVWQDYMFANFDYPHDDAEFLASVRREAEQFLSRTETNACIALLCGNSEVEQQAAMLGLPAELGKQPLFEDVLREISRQRRNDVPYLPSTPSGGALPFQVDSRISHYYGVGAYLRPLEDARRARVLFASECLAFANIPSDGTLERVLPDGQAPFHDPRWKARVPRDGGAGWDFDDVRDHYTQLLFGVDVVAQRSSDPTRALALGRVTSGEVMATTLAEWRRRGSTCRGALIWFFKDLWPGAGWGIVDALGEPKAAYYFVRRAMQPLALFLSDEGLNGLYLQLVNDTPRERTVDLGFWLLRGGKTQVAEGKLAGLALPGQSALELPAARLLERFLDTTYAYRFGPPSHDLAVARMTDSASGEELGSWSYFPQRLPSGYDDELELRAIATELEPGVHSLSLTANRAAHWVALELPGFEPEDSYFHLYPGVERRVLVRGRAGVPLKGVAQPLNSRAPVRVQASGQGS